MSEKERNANETNAPFVGVRDQMLSTHIPCCEHEVPAFFRFEDKTIAM